MFLGFGWSPYLVGDTTRKIIPTEANRRHYWHNFFSKKYPEPYEDYWEPWRHSPWDNFKHNMGKFFKALGNIFINLGRLFLAGIKSIPSWPRALIDLSFILNQLFYIAAGTYIAILMVIHLIPALIAAAVLFTLYSGFKNFIDAHLGMLGRIIDRFSTISQFFGRCINRAVKVVQNDIRISSITTLIVGLVLIPMLATSFISGPIALLALVSVRAVTLALSATASYMPDRINDFITGVCRRIGLAGVYEEPKEPPTKDDLNLGLDPENPIPEPTKKNENYYKKKITDLLPNFSESKLTPEQEESLKPITYSRLAVARGTVGALAMAAAGMAAVFTGFVPILWVPLFSVMTTTCGAEAAASLPMLFSYGSKKNSQVLPKVTEANVLQSIPPEDAEANKSIHKKTSNPELHI